MVLSLGRRVVLLIIFDESMLRMAVSAATGPPLPGEEQPASRAAASAKGKSRFIIVPAK